MFEFLEQDDERDMEDFLTELSELSDDALKLIADELKADAWHKMH